MKEREKRKLGSTRYTWTEWGIQALREQNSFITTDQLWDIVCQKHEIPVGRGSGNAQLKGSAVHKCWMRTKKMMFHKEKIGLVEWKEDMKLKGVI